jgi:predicted nucleotidyltransferase
MNAIKEMLAKRDYNDMLQIFNEEKVRFIVIGGMAAMLHGYVRATKDLDLWVLANQENSVRVINALRKFGAPMDDISEKDFEKEGVIFQIGVDPIRIDVTTTIEGIKFDEAYSNIEMVEIDGVNIPLISISDLIRNKKASGRMQDLADIAQLEKILERKSQNR